MATSGTIAIRDGAQYVVGFDVEPRAARSAQVDVITALQALPSVERPLSRYHARARTNVTTAAANVLAILGSLSFVSLAYLVYFLLGPAY